MTGKRIIIIAGPNGAGKTTFAREYLPNEAGCPTFVNADLIADGLSPFRRGVAELRAGRLMLEEIRRHARARRSFAFETTLSGRTYIGMIRRWRDEGYHVKLVFLGLATPEEAICRVRQRVRQGGHDVRDCVVRRRFVAGLCNFEMVYRHCVDQWVWYSNSGKHPVLLDQGKRGMMMSEPREKRVYSSGESELGDEMAALLRAAKRAHEIARRTGTRIVIRQDGEVVEIDPDPEMFDGIEG